jgi:hypothetical protein
MRRLREAELLKSGLAVLLVNGVSNLNVLTSDSFPESFSLRPLITILQQRAT